MEEMYEVLSFVEHGAHCRQAMDCVQGTLLIEYLREKPEVDKYVLFDWFRKIAVSMERYHRCRNYQNYKYLNPYSVVVMEDEDIRLLDMEAPENGFVMKQMQKRAMRSHFVKPVYEMESWRKNGADLFAYGKTVRFILACAYPVPELSRWEEARLMKLTERCMGETKREYEDFQDVLKELPAVKKKNRPEKRKMERRTIGLAGGAAACVILCAALAAGRQGLASGSESWEQEEPEMVEEAAVSAQPDITTEMAAQPDITTEASDPEEIVEQAAEILESYMAFNDENGWKKAVYLGEKLEEEAVRYLAAAYRKTGDGEAAQKAYGRLIELGESADEIEEAGLGKMELEAETGNYDQAVQTGRSVLEKIGDSEPISARIAEYEASGGAETGTSGGIEAEADER